MGLLSFLSFGKIAGDTIASPVTAIGNVVDKLFTSDNERMQADAVMEKLRQNPDILQVEINKLEAQSNSLFVSGWRPFTGWICGIGLAWHYLLAPIISWCCAVWSPGTIMPVINGTGDLINLLLAMLGMAGIRTFEKVNKITK